MAVILVMMFGQIGGLAGNVLFPLLLDLNCSVPFFLLAALLLGKLNQDHRLQNNNKNFN